MNSKELIQQLEAVLNDIGDFDLFNDQFDNIVEILDGAVSAGLGQMEIQACVSEVFGFDPKIEGMIRLFLNGDRSQLTQLKNYLAQSLASGNFSLSFYPTVETVGAVDTTKTPKRVDSLAGILDVSPRVGIADADRYNLDDASGVVMQLADSEPDGSPKKKVKAKAKKKSKPRPATLFSDDGTGDDDTTTAETSDETPAETPSEETPSTPEDTSNDDEATEAPSANPVNNRLSSIGGGRDRPSFGSSRRPMMGRFGRDEEPEEEEAEPEEDDSNPNLDSLKEAFKGKTPEEIDQIMFEVEDKIGSKVAAKIRKEAIPDDEDEDLSDEDTEKVKAILNAGKDKKDKPKEKKSPQKVSDKQIADGGDETPETNTDEDKEIPEPTEPTDDVPNDNTDEGDPEAGQDVSIFDDDGEDSDDGEEVEEEEPEEVEIEEEENSDEGVEADDEDDETDDEDFDMPTDKDTGEDFEWEDEVEVEEETPETDEEAEGDDEATDTEEPKKEEKADKEAEPKEKKADDKDEDKEEADKDDEEAETKSDDAEDDELPEEGEVEQPAEEEPKDEAEDDTEEKPKEEDEKDFSKLRLSEAPVPTLPSMPRNFALRRRAALLRKKRAMARARQFSYGKREQRLTPSTRLRKPRQFSEALPTPLMRKPITKPFQFSKGSSLRTPLQRTLRPARPIFNRNKINQSNYSMIKTNFAKLLDNLTPEKASEALTIIGSKCGNEVADAVQAHCVGGKCEISSSTIPTEKVKRIIEIVQKSPEKRNFSGEQKRRYDRHMRVFAQAFSASTPKKPSTDKTQMATALDRLTPEKAAQALTIIGSKCGNEVAKATQAMALSEFKHFSDIDEIDVDAVLADFPQDDVEDIIEEVDIGTAPAVSEFSPRERMQYRKYLSLFADAEAELDADIEADVEDLESDMEDAEKALDSAANFARRRRRSRSRSRRSSHRSSRRGCWFADKEGKAKKMKDPGFATDSDIDSYAGKYVAKKPEVDKEDMVDYLTAKRELLKSCAAVASNDGDKKLLSEGKKANKAFQKVANKFKKDYKFTPDTDKLTKSKDRSWEKKGLSLIEGGKNKTKQTNMSKIQKVNFAEIAEELEDLTPEGASEVLVKVDEECGPEAADAVQMALLTGCNAQFADVNGRELAGVINRAIATVKRRGEKPAQFSGMSKFRYLKNLALFSCAFSEDEDVELIDGVEAPVSDEEAIDSFEAPEEFADKKDCECGECDDCKAKEEKKEAPKAEKKVEKPAPAKAKPEAPKAEGKEEAKAEPTNESILDDDEEPANVGEIVSDGNEAMFVEDTTAMPEVAIVVDDDDENPIDLPTDAQFMDDESDPADPEEAPDFTMEIDDIDEGDLDVITDEDVDVNFSEGAKSDKEKLLNRYDYILGNKK